MPAKAVIDWDMAALLYAAGEPIAAIAAKVGAASASSLSSLIHRRARTGRWTSRRNLALNWAAISHDISTGLSTTIIAAKHGFRDRKALTVAMATRRKRGHAVPRLRAKRSPRKKG